MSRTPIENQADLRIGFVEYIAPDEINVQLDLEAPEEIAANAGIPRQFPRINSYVIIPSEGGYIVCQIEWINIERSAFPKRKGYKDYGLIDLPFPLRKMMVVPVGTLKRLTLDDFKFSRGVNTFPSIGSPVLIPTDNQLGAIIKSGSNRRVFIGNSLLTSNEKVKIDPDKLFGRHLAVLGNTGSGKSCTVAGLIQWSMEAIEAQGVANPNARFIILDPNGEYGKVFGDDAKVLKVNSDDENKLEVPLWLWNSEEWKTFTQAKPGAQLPLLKRSLRAMRNGIVEYTDTSNFKIKNFLGNIIRTTDSSKKVGEPFDRFPHPKNFTERLDKWKTSLESFGDTNLNNLIEQIEDLVNSHKEVKSTTFTDYPIYTIEEVESLKSSMTEVFLRFGGELSELFPKSEDTPIPFRGEDFLNYIKALAEGTGNEQYLEFLIERIGSLLGDSRMESIIGNQTERELDKWLEKYLGNTSDKTVTIIDLSLVPTEIVHIIISVISRILFESLQRYRKHYSDALPTILVMEEAHSFITRYSDINESENSAICTKVFEKISREGRKFGLGLVLSSQRPSELSPTVLSQCNSFILHRISNSRDQELVSRLLPDSFRGLLKELPSLSSQIAILLGWASELPVLMKVRDLPKEKRPQSEDPDFWNVWTRKDDKGEEVKRDVDWNLIANDWQSVAEIEESEDTNNDIEEGTSDVDDLPF